MASMDQSPDTPGETAGDSAPTGGATAFGALFSHEESAVPAATVKKTAARKATKSATKTAAAKTAAKTATKKSTAKKTSARKSTARAKAADEAVEELLDAGVGTSAGDAGGQSGEQASPDVTEPAQGESAKNEPVEQGPAKTEPAKDESAKNEPVEDDEDAEDAEEQSAPAGAGSPFGMLFQAPDLSAVPARPARRAPAQPAQDTDEVEESGAPERPSRQRTRRPVRGGQTSEQTSGQDNSQDRADSGDSQAKASPDQDQNHQQDDDHDDQDDGEGNNARRRRRRGGKGRRGRGSAGDDSGDTDGPDTTATDSTNGSDTASSDADGTDAETSGGTVRRRRRSNRRGEDGEARESRRAREEVTGVRGSTRLEAKRQRRREGREAGRRRTIITEAEFLARRESVERTMVVRGHDDRTQIGVLEDGVLVEHYVSRATQTTMVGNVYLGRVQNVLPSMEAAFVDIGKGRNAVLYAGEVNWDAAGLDNNQPKRIENALKSGDSVLVQVTKDPIGHKGARLTSQISLPGRYLVLVPGNSMTGISRKLPDTERARLKKILKEVVPEGAGVIVRTAAEGASEAELRADVERLTGMWDRIQGKQKGANAPALLHGEPDMTVRVIRDVFNEDFAKVVVAGEQAWTEVSDYLGDVAPDLADRLEKWTGTQDVFSHYRVTEALAKAMDRKVWLPSGGSLVIDRTEAMTVVDVNTGKFVGSGGNLEETVTKNNIEAAEEIVRQLRLRDIGGIIVIDFIDMVLESNRDLVVRRLLECLGRDRTKHQVAEVTSLGLVQMTRKRVGAGLIEVFSEQCVHCNGRGILVQSEPIDKSEGHGHQHGGGSGGNGGSSGGGRRGRGRSGNGGDGGSSTSAPTRPTPAPGGPTPAQIAAAAHAAAIAGSAQPQDDAAPEESSPAATQASGERSAEPTTPHTAQAVAQPEPQESVAPAESREAVVRAEPKQAAEPQPAVTPEPAVAPRPRRRRGRVVAPAGPPGGVETDAESDAATPASDNS
ncbi:Rne/Rng family ribonuclease [Ornithinimicrobium faecis]|uniref:Rne/Rng family ribonuclease n=1 Tax=Ornithinimicrobium faecis TaxID=2934158 RepID=A0ABY4YP28_9MICO|nr:MULTISPECIES: ribonuclease E/G [unclassified Ornithinimicrobium]USQ78538.1 Rne/Rng family ribonuclease [Ornithinimicrobium sp. HY1793]